MQVGVAENGGWKRPSAQICSRGIPAPELTRPCVILDLSPAGKPRRPTGRQLGIPPLRSMRTFARFRAAFLVAFAYALCHFAASTRGYSVAMRRPVFEAGECCTRRTDHSPRIASRHSILLTYAHVVQGSECKKCLDDRRTLYEVSSPSGSGGFSLYVSDVVIVAWEFCVCKCGPVHGASYPSWYSCFCLCSHGTCVAHYESPGGGIRLGFLLCSAPHGRPCLCGFEPGGGRRLGFFPAWLGRGSVCFRLGHSPGGGARLGLARAVRCRALALSPAAHNNTLGGGKRPRMLLCKPLLNHG